MSKKLISTTLIAMTLLTSTAVVFAREGTPIGKGIKCSTKAVTVNGITTFQQVCFKGV